jgi:hypothetical protein
MKIKISEATGLILDGLVAISEGYTLTTDGISILVEKDGKLQRLGFVKDRNHGYGYGPSTDPAKAWEIIERETISMIRLEDAERTDANGFWVPGRDPVHGAVIGTYFADDVQRNSYGESGCDIFYIGKDEVTTGPTALIAAMRCYLSSKFGVDAEVPEVLRSMAMDSV